MMVRSDKIDELKLRNEFTLSEDLRVEFGGDIEAYVAFKKAEAGGRARIHVGRCRQRVTSKEFADDLRLEEIDKELERLRRLRKKSGEGRANQADDERRQYVAGTPCLCQV